MKRESIFAQIERHERFRRKMEARHKKHTESGKRRPSTCFQCRLEILRENREAGEMARALQLDAEKLEALTRRVHDERILVPCRNTQERGSETGQELDASRALTPHMNPHAQALGKLGGKVKSEAKAAAARENGKKGGRPRGDRRDSGRAR